MNIPGSKLGDGESIVVENSLDELSIVETYHIGSFNNTLWSSIVV